MRKVGVPYCSNLMEMAEREGFEPSIGINLYALSRGAPSAARPPLRKARDDTTADSRDVEAGSLFVYCFTTKSGTPRAQFVDLIL